MSELETEVAKEETQQENSLPPESLALLKSVREMLNEEKWTRAALGNYSTGQFKEFDSILKEAKKLRIIDEMKKACDEHLAHTKNSIIALYLSGMVALSRQIIDDAAMINLVTIFADNHKWAIVRYLCERILSYGESKYALRLLIDCCKNENNEEALYGIWERLVKVDYEEADLAKALAEHYEKQGNNETAVEYYKKALHRYINKALYSNIKEIWEKLINFRGTHDNKQQLSPEDIDFFLHVQKKVAKNINEEKAIELLRAVYAKCKEHNIDTAIVILKNILQYDERDYSARKDIIECFRKKYAGHSQLEDYIRISSLSQSIRNVHDAIADFEKHIAFDKGNFVYHRTWGVGRITGIEGDEIKIDFTKKRGHAMSLKMAIEALQTLPKDHIWVLKATSQKKDMVGRVLKEITTKEGTKKTAINEDEIPNTLRIIIKSFGNSCDIKRIKAELCPSLLSEKEWNAWHSRARETLKSHSDFDVSPDNIDVFTVRDRPISVAEKLYNQFKAERNFFDRADIIRDFVSKKDFEIDSDYFAEMFAYVSSFLKSSNQTGEQTIAAYLLIKELAAKYPHLGANLSYNFADIIKEINDIPGLFISLKNSRFKDNFLSHVQMFVPEWPDIFIELFPRTMVTSIISKLEEEGFHEKLTAMAIDCFERFRDRRETVVWLIKNAGEKEWFKAAGIGLERQIIVMIHILDLTYRDIENQRDTAEARKINKQVYNILFNDGVLGSFIESIDVDTVSRIYTFISDVKNLDPQLKINLRGKIQKRFPDFKFIDETIEKKTLQGLIGTRAKYEEKQRVLVHIMDVEVPANSREIEAARQHGDLKENAEYSAAKEKQVQLNTQAEKLKEELERAQIFDPAAVNTSKVSFGTVVVLQNESSEKKEEYTILGPWESDPEKNVINYQAPFGRVMLNKTAGEHFTFISDGVKNVYTVESIRAAEI